MSNNYLIFDVGVGVSEVKISVIKSLLVPPPLLNNPLGVSWEVFSFSKYLKIRSQPFFQNENVHMVCKMQIADLKQLEGG